jgi:alpha-glucosidase
MTVTELRESVAALVDSSHHDGSELYVVDRPSELGESAVLRVRTRTGAADRVLLRYVRDGEPRTAEGVVDEERGGETWWRAELPVWNPTVRYRWLLAGGETGYAWLNGVGLTPHEVAGADDFVLSLRAAPTGTSGRSCTRSSPTGSRAPGL